MLKSAEYSHLLKSGLSCPMTCKIRSCQIKKQQKTNEQKGCI